MISHGGPRADQTQLFMDTIINNRIWGLLLLDEAHVAQAPNYSQAIRKINARCKLGLTAILVREEDKIADLEGLVGSIPYSVNWKDYRTRLFSQRPMCRGLL